MSGPDETRLWEQWYVQAIKQLGMDEEDATDYADLRLRSYVDKMRDHDYLEHIESDELD